MTRFQFSVAIIGLYACLAVIVLGAVAIVAAVTVVPMIANYRECGSVFLCTPEGER